MTPAQKDALLDLRRNGGEGVISKTGSLVVGGVRLPYLADTWLRLMTLGLVEPRGPMRLGLTNAGASAATEPERKVNPDLIRKADGRVEPMKGAE